MEYTKSRSRMRSLPAAPSLLQNPVRKSVPYSHLSGPVRRQTTGGFPAWYLTEVKPTLSTRSWWVSESSRVTQSSMSPNVFRHSAIHNTDNWAVLTYRLSMTTTTSRRPRLQVEFDLYLFILNSDPLAPKLANIPYHVLVHTKGWCPRIMDTLGKDSQNITC